MAIPSSRPRELLVRESVPARVYEEARDAAWARRAVFVAAPDGKVDAPVVQCERDVGEGVCEVPAYDDVLVAIRSNVSTQLER